MADTPTDAQMLATYNALAVAMQSKDPGDSRGAGSPGWPVIGELKTIDGHVMRWTRHGWSRADAVV
ncbi:hypothetical protein [Methylobacterium sp. E-066]|uniref:hypothetical protein n=1 Tax=Methylobacterium sp. E-066 TaxID=2836584 RepID=UPI001FB92104|nr:hypothetical protein [Methylobacterium sp. E-066]MCJ2142165.1 hypothetical protein [Methylobacterium sp. E-066]